MATQKVVDWINEKFFVTKTYNKEDFEQMESFCLLWNLFEKKVADGSETSLGLSKIEKFATKNSQYINIDNTIMEDCFNYFQNRYIENGTTNAQFDNLKFRQNDTQYSDKLKNILTNNSMSSTESEKILGILTIAYRIRNNSFHGTKELPEIVNQKETFKHFNDFLMSFLNRL